MGSTHRIEGSMEDGRFMMDYSSSCRLNTLLQNERKIPSWNSTQYRKYLQEHGLKAMNALNTQAPCGPYACADLGAAFAEPAIPNTVKPDAAATSAEQ